MKNYRVTLIFEVSDSNDELAESIANGLEELQKDFVSELVNDFDFKNVTCTIKEIRGSE